MNESSNLQIKDEKVPIEQLEDFANNVLELWRKPDSIRKQFAPDLTGDEFSFFMGLGISLKANPFNREIWAVKYDKSKPAAIFLGRDFYRKKAQEQPDYSGHVSHAVCENDMFKVENGVVLHEYSVKDRGELVGAYAFVYRKEMAIPIYVYVKFSEYQKKKADGTIMSLWKTHPETMIKKVAEAQALRMAYQGLFRGAYSEDEQYEIKQARPAVKVPEAIEPEKSLGDENATPDE